MEFVPLWFQVLIWAAFIIALFELGIAQGIMLLVLKVSTFIFYCIHRFAFREPI